MIAVRQRLPLVVLFAIALVACAAVLWTTRGGVGLTNDSHAYLRIAEGLGARLHGGVGAAGDELSRRFPPGLPALLVAGRAIARGDFPRAGRWLNVACLFASTLLVAAIVRRATQRPAPAIVAAALFVASIGTLSTHVFLWSEPAFTLVMLASVLTLGAFLRDGGWRWLGATALLAAAAISLRYAAAALVLAECLLVLVRSPRPRVWQRFRDAAALGVAPTLALAAWLGTGPARGAIAGRTVAFVPIAGRRVDQLMHTLAGWLFAGLNRPLFVNVTAAVAIAALVWAIVRAIRSRDVTLALPWAFACAYPLFLVVSMSLFDPDTPLDPRILAPLHTLAIVLTCATFGQVASRRGVAIVVAIASVLVAVQVAGAALYLRATAAGGMGYAGARWQSSETVQYAAALAGEPTLFTTHQTALQIILGRPVFDLPYRRDGADEADVKRQFNAMLRQIDAAGHRGYVVYVRRTVAKGKTYVTPKDLARYFRIERDAKLSDGEVYKVESRARPPGKRKKPSAHGKS